MEDPGLGADDATYIGTSPGTDMLYRAITCHRRQRYSTSQGEPSAVLRRAYPSRLRPVGMTVRTSQFLSEDLEVAAEFTEGREDQLILNGIGIVDEQFNFNSQTSVRARCLGSIPDVIRLKCAGKFRR